MATESTAGDGLHEVFRRVDALRGKVPDSCDTCGVKIQCVCDSCGADLLANRAANYAEMVKEIARLREAKDGAYLERNRVVALAARMALVIGLRTGLARTAIEGWSEDWHGCVYIDLPNGQASWHFHDSHAGLFHGLPEYHRNWDGHDTSEKYRRVDEAFTKAAQS